MLGNSEVVFLSLVVYQCSSQSLVRVGGGTKSFVCSFKVLSYLFFFFRTSQIVHLTKLKFSQHSI